jgi:hypothetical protein
MIILLGEELLSGREVKEARANCSGGMSPPSPNRRAERGHKEKMK